eukprot:1180793-Prorocentrum_minimum.AAC.2
MSSLLVTLITFGHYIRLLLYVPSPAPERTLSSGRPGCARGFFMRAGRQGPAITVNAQFTFTYSNAGVTVTPYNNAER